MVTQRRRFFRCCWTLIESSKHFLFLLLVRKTKALSLNLGTTNDKHFRNNCSWLLSINQKKKGKKWNKIKKTFPQRNKKSENFSTLKFNLKKRKKFAENKASGWWATLSVRKRESQCQMRKIWKSFSTRFKLLSESSHLAALIDRSKTLCLTDCLDLWSFVSLQEFTNKEELSCWSDSNYGNPKQFWWWKLQTRIPTN